MKIFVIHRHKDKNEAKTKLKCIAQKLSFNIKPIFLDGYSKDLWKDKAINAIKQAESIVIFNRSFCEKSENSIWEIERAIEEGKKIIEMNGTDDDQAVAERLQALYDFEEEFKSCFSSNNKDTLELYKIMLNSSESLIQRRQNTNSFFITIMGGLLAIIGLLVKINVDVINSEAINIVLFGLAVVGFLLCISWYNLIDNYGKLNKAKYDVILRLEKELSAQIYSAEWIALGKGLRPKKYKSFTSTEKRVPIYFGLLIVTLPLIALFWKTWGEKFVSWICALL